MDHPDGGHVTGPNPMDNDTVRAQLSPARLITNMAVIVRDSGWEFEVGTAEGIEIPARENGQYPLTLELSDLEPVLAEVLRGVADAIEREDQADAVRTDG